MFSDRVRRILNTASYFLASLVLAWGIWWFWKHGWPNPLGMDMHKFQFMLFFGAPTGILIGIVAFFYGPKK